MTPNEISHFDVAVQPEMTVTIMVGPRVQSSILPGEPGYKRPAKLEDRTMAVRFYDRVIDILQRLSLPTDGSMVMLVPGTYTPFWMEGRPYSCLSPNLKVSIVPNRPGEVGPGATPAAAVPAPAKPRDPMATAAQVIVPDPATSTAAPELHVESKYPMQMSTPDKTSVILVENAQEEKEYLDKGYSID